MNDERPIEKLLRRYAKKRRDDAGPPVDLHPATRRLLQGEVARQFRKNAPGGTPASLTQMLNGWRLQLAWAVPLFALVVIGLWSLRGRPEPQQLAMSSTTRQRTADEKGRVSKGESRAPESLTLAVNSQPAPAAPPALGELGAAKALTPTPVSAPARSLNQPVPTRADRGLGDEKRRSEPTLAYGGAQGQSGNSFTSGVEQKRDSARFGLNEIAAADKSAAVPPVPPALGLSPATASANLQLTNSNVRSFATPTANTSLAGPATKNDSSSQPNRGIVGLSVAKASESVAPLLDAPEKPVPLARSDSLEREPAQTYSQSFANRAPESLKLKVAKTITPAPVSPVLANFRVEQTGRQLRVVDGDGSTYLGEAKDAPAVWTNGDGGKKEQVVQSFKSDGQFNRLPTVTASVPESQLQNNVSNFYRVAGTNRTLNQNVVFTWSYVEMTNPPVVAQSGRISNDLNKDVQKLPAQFPTLLQNSFINGRAQFDTGKEIEINAVPVTP